jgi:hypothetical protein
MHLCSGVDRVAHAIYFTPRAATLRLQILEAAAKARLALRGNARSPSEIESQKRDALQRIGRIVKRCLSHVQKRHNVIHDAWEIGTFHEGERVQGVVFRQRIDTALHFRDFEVVKIEDLQGLLDGFRHLIDDARSLTANLRARPPTMADLRKS